MRIDDFASWGVQAMLSIHRPDLYIRRGFRADSGVTELLCSTPTLFTLSCMPSRPAMTNRFHTICTRLPRRPGHGQAAHRSASPAAAISQWLAPSHPAAAAPAPAPLLAAWSSPPAALPSLPTSRPDPRCIARSVPRTTSPQSPPKRSSAAPNRRSMI